MYLFWCMLSVIRTITSGVMPTKYKSDSEVGAFLVFRPATQKLSLKWLMDFSTVTRILQVYFHSLVPRMVPGKVRRFFADRHRTYDRRANPCKGFSQEVRRLYFTS